mmetsp:Transcript_12403/g.17166  ORF Transcript_12403/g.17166 Transcript_12403/m.17166 type:complete len:202 (-) Transcript_12403:42-647(-)
MESKLSSSEKRKLRKKQRRQKKRRLEAQQRCEEEQQFSSEDETAQTNNNFQSISETKQDIFSDVTSFPTSTSADHDHGTKDVPKIYGPTKKDTPQHFGLRCKKCFMLLVPSDEDFDYVNGELKLNPKISGDKSWAGLVYQSGLVYCQKMHLVGKTIRSTFTNKFREIVVLKPEKTTFTENFVKNPFYKDSPIIQNKSLVEQ